MAKLCMGCMNPLPEEAGQCPVCGFSVDGSNPVEALALESVLQENYLVGRLLRAGSDSLLYLGYNRLLKEPCLIQEFFPAGLAERTANGGVAPVVGSEELFAELRLTFRSTMRSLARVKDLPTVIPLYDIVEENGSVYAISDYVEGVTLAQKIKQNGGRLPWAQAKPLFMSLSNGLEQLHQAGLLHLAICPENVLLSNDGRVLLRNFALPEARLAGGSLRPELAAGYAAPEQYSADRAAGAAADIYGLAATLFYTVTGNVPPAGNKRQKNSDDLFMPADVAEELSQPVCVTLFNALLVSPEQRTPTVADFREQLGLEPNVSALRDEVRADQQMEQAAPKRKKQVNPWVIVGITAAAVLLVLAAVWLALRGAPEEPDSSSDPISLPQISTTSTSSKKDKLYAVPNLLGKVYYEIDTEKLDGEMTVEVKYKEYNAKAKDTVIFQEPKAGEGVAKGTTIYLVVSLGKNDELTVPDVAGWKEEHAKLYLEALGFRVEMVYLQASEMEKGYVDGTDPVAGTKKKLGDTITLRVSNVSQPVADAPEADIE